MNGTTSENLVSPQVDLTSPLAPILDAFSYTYWDGILNTIGLWWDIYSIISIFISLLFFSGFIYAKIRYGELHHIESHHLDEAEKQWAAKNGTGTGKSTRWDAIQQRVLDNSPESWRVAIIEADILLDETLRNAGYVGQTLGEKLKSANPHSFTTVQDAWEAHKVRNEIAHVGSDFVLTKKTAQETILRFERVFREFGIV